MFQALASLGGFEFLGPGDADAREAAGGKAGSPLARAMARLDGRVGAARCWPLDSRERIFRLRNIARAWGTKIQSQGALALAVVEDPICFEPLVRKLHSLAVPIVAACQNIESLSHVHVPFSSRMAFLGRELDLLSRCALVITISREDTWLLKNFSIPTFYFPYFPSAPTQERLLRVRQARRGRAKRSVMLLGNAGNLATRQGMARVMEYWQEKNLSRTFDRLLLAGFRTDSFFADWGAKDHIEFLGPLSQDDLYEKLAVIKACLVFQEGGGGALTRIAEMLVAGIPVVAGSQAARSYHGLAGVSEFRELRDLEDALARAESEPGEIPPPAEPDAAALAARIQAILAERKAFPQPQ